MAEPHKKDRADEVNTKAELDANDQGGEPVLDENYPPWGEPLYWEEFKAWAKDNLPDYSLAVIDEQLADPVTAAGLQCYRAGRTASRHGHPGGNRGLIDFRAWASNNLHIRSHDPNAMTVAERCYLAGHMGA
jgi:hypothetical protein